MTAKAEKPKVKAMGKGELFTQLAAKTGLSKKDVSEIFTQLPNIMQLEMAKTGVFIIPGLVKATKIQKPARPAGTRENPFKKGEMMEVKAKAAFSVIKVRALKQLKDMV